MKKTLMVIILVIGGGFLWSLSQTNKSSLLQALPPSFRPAQAPTAAPSVASSPAQPSAPPQEAPPEFVAWLKQESETLEDRTPNPALKEAELRNKAGQLNSAEINHLTQRILLPETPARQRIFATYLLTLAPDNTKSGLMAVLEAPSAYPAQNPVHSPEEALATQEKSLRRMALDALLERAKNNPENQDELKAFLAQIKDEGLRNYAERRLQEMK